ncbi:MAG: hypothetical protein KJS83_10175 [Xanthomonadaceae bacterium]|nr:hypothetical protein [Xanthomonadaceae bacterium]MDE2224372.1 hypothetical protein [Xanthomonadaceae bacterium]
MGSTHIRSQERLRVKAGMLGQMTGGHTHPALGQFERAPVWSWLTTLSICDATIQTGVAFALLGADIPNKTAAFAGPTMLRRVKSILPQKACFFGNRDMRYSTQDTDMTTLTIP